ncbi:hypothetical protein DFJ69_0542 [Thermomonospora umbrina]|uniref:Uncharacterized protein n=1 Tax=Thermomonospora umbrina TaxID=111806 RepID=A0A3D9SL81_9ACTN|nr:hypothetical protein DFJ69_0542 [Thermomonospora umbrina]
MGGRAIPPELALRPLTTDHRTLPFPRVNDPRRPASPPIPASTATAVVGREGSSVRLRTRPRTPSLLNAPGPNGFGRTPPAGSSPDQDVAPPKNCARPEHRHGNAPPQRHNPTERRPTGSNTASAERRPTGTPPYRNAALPERRPTGTPPYRNAALPERRPTGTPPYRNAALPERRPTGTPPYRNAALPERRPTGTPPYRNAASARTRRDGSCRGGTRREHNPGRSVDPRYREPASEVKRVWLGAQGSCRRTPEPRSAGEAGEGPAAEHAWRPIPGGSGPGDAHGWAPPAQSPFRARRRSGPGRPVSPLRRDPPRSRAEARVSAVREATRPRGDAPT